MKGSGEDCGNPHQHDFQIIRSKVQGQVINQVLIRKGEIHIRKHFWCLLSLILKSYSLNIRDGPFDIWGELGFF